ncbi:MAG: DUF2326 domain-containing protein [Alphaproteobacteria bacterium]|nr:MAG: DUF2326 domain-containing protein [Alphaproteobacteria bacterium]
MKLSCLYSNKPDIFSPIRFRDGLNVVLAHIRHPKDESKLGHNLGKTLLIEILDFCFLKKVSKDHLFKRHSELFADFVFFLELQLSDVCFLTIRRSASEPTKIAFKRHNQAGQNFTNIDEDGWDHWRETFDNAVVLLDSILAFTSIKPWSYRKGLGYFLRGQSDYGNVFQLSKFGVGRHKDWKPYIAKILGFNDAILTEKYDADAATAKLQNDASEIQSEVTLKTKDFDKLRASIAVKRNEVETKVLAIDAFDFHGQEADLAREVAESTEVEISENNNLLYNARHDLAQIERGLADAIHFDLDDVKRVFEEAQITFPNQLARDYDDLIEFNRRIHTERRTALIERASTLKLRIFKLESDNASLAKRRMEILQILGGTDSLQKFKDLQRQIDQDRANLTLMETKASKLESLIAIQDQVRHTKSRADELNASIQQMIHQGSERYSEIQLNFSRIMKEVTQRTALLYVDQNGEGNLDFHAEFNDDVTDLHTEESRGTSFRQLLCIAFDLAILISHSKEPFFHFVYHDGGLERLQNKLKLALLKVIRETCEQYGIQYMFSAISEDIPYAEDSDNLCPTPEEIVLTLDDSGDGGRLFKMATF